jgi:hypothetical protein
VSDNRVHVPDPVLMRRAGNRMVIAMVMILILTLPFTVGGISLLIAGELPGLPLAVGGFVLEICSIVLVAASLRVRRTLDGQTIARPALLAARRVAGGVRRTAVVTILALILFGLIRSAFGDGWSLLTAAILSIGLFLLARGTKTMGKAQDRALAQTQ